MKVCRVFHNGDLGRVCLVLCDVTQRWQTFIESRVRSLQLMLSWEKLFPLLVNSKETPPQHRWRSPTSCFHLLSGLSHRSLNCSPVIVHTKSKKRSPVTTKFNLVSTQTTGSWGSLSPRSLNEVTGISKQAGSTSAAGRGITSCCAPGWRRACKT